MQSPVLLLQLITYPTVIYPNLLIDNPIGFERISFYIRVKHIVRTLYITVLTRLSISAVEIIFFCFLWTT